MLKKFERRKEAIDENISLSNMYLYHPRFRSEKTLRTI